MDVGVFCHGCLSSRCQLAALGSGGSASHVGAVEGNEVMKPPVGTSFAASMASLGVATCCVLPMTMMLLGLGGSWIAVFGKISAASYYVLTISTGILVTAWYIA